MRQTLGAALNVVVRVMVGQTVQSIGVLVDDPFANRADHAQTRFGITGVVLDELGIDRLDFFVEISRLGIVLRPWILDHTAIIRRRRRPHPEVELTA